MRGGLFERLGLSVRARRILFYCVCLPVRVLLALSILLLPWPLVSTAAAGAVIVNVLGHITGGEVRWSRAAHAAFAAGIAVAAPFSAPVAAALALGDVAYGAASLRFAV
jgi:hypothetical protein